MGGTSFFLPHNITLKNRSKLIITYIDFNIYKVVCKFLINWNIHTFTQVVYLRTAMIIMSVKKKVCGCIIYMNSKLETQTIL